jgi:pimeloyl-ACP methyl ester carboxylesterase
VSIKPVVFIPGFPASELIQTSKNRTIFPPAPTDLLDKGKKEKLIRLLIGPDLPPGDIVAGQPIRHVLSVSKQAESLYDILRDFGYTTRSGDNFAAIGWDWRLAVDHVKVQTDVVAAIDRLSQANASKVVVIAHSTGGLVLRRLLEMRPDVAGRIEQVLSFGIPWAGTLKAVRFVAKGEPFGFFPAKLNASEVRDIMSHCQAAYDLFPPDPVKTDLQDAAGKRLDLVVGADGSQKGLLVDHSWIPSSPQKSYMREMANLADSRLGRRSAEIRIPGADTPPITNVVGWGFSTDTRAVLDGGRLDLTASDEGDGTVPLASAAWLRGANVRTFFIPIGVYPTAGIPNSHARIWDSPPVLELFDQVLRSKAPEPFVCAAADADEAIDRRSDVTLRLVALDEKGLPLSNAQAVFHGLPQPVTAKFHGAGRLKLILKRGAMRPNVARDLFRFGIDFTWGEGAAARRREVPMLVRA